MITILIHVRVHTRIVFSICINSFIYFSPRPCLGPLFVLFQVSWETGWESLSASLQGKGHCMAEQNSNPGPALQLLTSLLSHLELQGSNFLTSHTNIPLPLGP